MPRRIAVLATVSLAAVCAPAEARTLVDYTATGGLAGMYRTVTVGSHGRTHVSDNLRGTKRYRLSTKRLRALKHALRAAHFSTLKRAYRPDGVVNDGITETVTYRGRTVTVETGGRAPDRLKRLLQRLQGL